MKRFFEMKSWRDNMVYDKDQIKTALFILTGKEETSESLDNMMPLLRGIKGEVKPEEWKRFAPHHLTGAMKMYRELTGCSLKEAKEAVEKERRMI